MSFSVALFKIFSTLYLFFMKIAIPYNLVYVSPSIYNISNTHYIFLNNHLNKNHVADFHSADLGRMLTPSDLLPISQTRSSQFIACLSFWVTSLPNLCTSRTLSLILQTQLFPNILITCLNSNSVVTIISRLCFKFDLVTFIHRLLYKQLQLA